MYKTAFSRPWGNLSMNEGAKYNRFRTTMIDNRQDFESIEESPFQEEAILENYVAVANRSEVLSQMKEAVQNGVALLVLTGEEGSGKTMLCRLFEHEASTSCKTVFFPRAVDSFDDVLRIIAQRLGLDAGIEMGGGNVDQALDDITDFLLSQAEDVELLVIFDEAENIFLATLERIRKMLDRINGSGARMHILFSGKKAFLENCDQLSICDFQNSDKCHFELTPLSKAETVDYLRNCAARLTGIDASNVFTDEAVTNIAELAKGNFRMINILGEESVKTPGDDTSFMVLLKSIKEGVLAGDGISGDGLYPNLIKKFGAYLPWVGGAICLLLLIFLLSPGDDESGVGQDTGQTEKSETVIVELSEQVQPLEEKLLAIQVAEENVSGEQEIVPLPVEQSVQPDIDQVVEMVEQGVAETTEITETVEVIETTEKNEIEAVVDVVEDIVEQAPQVQVPLKAVTGENDSHAVPHLTQAKKKAIGLSLKPEIEKTKALPRAEVQKDRASTASVAVEQLYRERLFAGAGWAKREKQNMYTVQIMALASADAEKNLKKMLALVDYRQEAGNFYIFKKTTAPGYLYVFYGEYPSLERAKLVKNSLPKFLRDHKPYALSIKGAIAKVK